MGWWPAPADRRGRYIGMLIVSWKHRAMSLGRVAFDCRVRGVLVSVEAWTGGGYGPGHALVRISGRLVAIWPAGDA